MAPSSFSASSPPAREPVPLLLPPCAHPEQEEKEREEEEEEEGENEVEKE